MSDARIALRYLRARPGSTVTMLATLALGIGATAAMAAVVHAVLLALLPVSDLSRLVLWGLLAAVLLLALVACANVAGL